MDTDKLIRALNTITEPHFTSGGRHVPAGDSAQDGLVLAAWHARNALYPTEHRSITDRVCDLLRAKEAIGQVRHARITSGEVAGLTYTDLDNVQNAIAWATSLVCDEIRTLELVKPKRKAAK